MTTADLYCSRGDVSRRLPPGSLASPAGIVASSPAATNVVSYNGHGLSPDDPVRVRAVEDGALPAPLAEGVVYYALPLTNDTFELAATPGGAPIDLTSDAVSMVVIRDLPFEEIIEFYSRWADAILPAHIVPLQSPIHPTVKGVVADLSAKRLQNIAGQDSAIIDAAEVAGKAMLERFGAGIPLRGAATTSPANLAVSAALGAVSDPRGWGSGRLP